VSVNGTEELEAGKWIKKQVEAELGSAISGAWLDLIPEGANFPAVKFNAQNRMDVRTVAQHIVFANITFQVVATIDNESVLPLVDLANRIFLALHRRSGTTETARILACTRIQPWGSMDNEQGHTFRSSGGIYELLVQSLD
jgi:hypothetical protein